MTKTLLFAILLAVGSGAVAGRVSAKLNMSALEERCRIAEERAVVAEEQARFANEGVDTLSKATGWNSKSIEEINENMANLLVATRANVRSIDVILSLKR